MVSCLRHGASAPFITPFVLSLNPQASWSLLLLAVSTLLFLPRRLYSTAIREFILELKPCPMHVRGGPSRERASLGRLHATPRNCKANASSDIRASFELQSTELANGAGCQNTAISHGVMRGPFKGACRRRPRRLAPPRLASFHPLRRGVISSDSIH